MIIAHVYIKKDAWIGNRSHIGDHIHCWPRIGMTLGCVYQFSVFTVISVDISKSLEKVCFERIKALWIFQTQQSGKLFYTSGIAQQNPAQLYP